VKNNQEYQVMAIVGGPKRGEEQSINISAPKEVGSYSLKMEMKSGEVVSWNNMHIDVKLSAKELAKKKAEEELAQKKAQEELAKKQAEELAKKQVEEDAARQKAIEEAMKQRQEEETMEKQRQIEKSRVPAEQKTEEKKYCDPELPKFWQPGCIEQVKEAPQQREPEGQVPTYSKPKQPTAPEPTKEGAKICDPNIPRYSQPGCVEE